MITGVSGILEDRGAGWVQLRVGGGVSFQIFVPQSTVENLGGIGDEVRLHTRLYVRDDEPVLYGFSSPEALRLFQTLNGVAGVGPRTALSLLSSMGSQSLINAVASGDVDALSRAPGVGKRTAGRLVLELKGKLQGEMAPSLSQFGGEDEEVVSALMALGYSAVECRRVVASAGNGNELSLEERIRRALQQLAG